MANATKIIVGTWTLGSTNSVPARESFAPGRMPTGDEGNFDDQRMLVEDSKRQPGGDYYAIVKLQIRFQGQVPDDQRYAQATGWLIAPNLLVTAGHCVFDHTYQFGKATVVKAYVGYNGRDSIGIPGVQFRRGTRVATTNDWIQSDANQGADVAFIQFDQPFDNIHPFKFQPTPTQAETILEVVGYPIDKARHDEAGAQMYTVSKPVSFNLDQTASNMLQYPIFTYSGQSGGPVLIHGSRTAIGVQVIPEVSSASVIRGKYGNHYSAYIDTFTKSFPSTQAGGISYVTVSLDEQEASITDVQPARRQISSDISELKAQSVLPIAQSFLGPIGGPISAVAGAALGSASRMQESSMDDDF